MQTAGKADVGNNRILNDSAFIVIHRVYTVYISVCTADTDTLPLFYFLNTVYVAADWSSRLVSVPELFCSKQLEMCRPYKAAVTLPYTPVLNTVTNVNHDTNLKIS